MAFHASFQPDKSHGPCGRRRQRKENFSGGPETWHVFCSRFYARESVITFAEAIKMKRRDFLKSAAVAGGSMGLAVLMQSGCSSNSSPSNPSDSASHTFTSSTDSGHSHTVTMSQSEVNSPPAGGISRQTSSSSGHTHVFSMAQAQMMMMMQGGGAVSVTTSVDSGHSHTFSMMKWF